MSLYFRALALCCAGRKHWVLWLRSQQRLQLCNCSGLYFLFLVIVDILIFKSRCQGLQKVQYWLHIGHTHVAFSRKGICKVSEWTQGFLQWLPTLKCCVFLSALRTSDKAFSCCRILSIMANLDPHRVVILLLASFEEDTCLFGLYWGLSSFPSWMKMCTFLQTDVTRSNCASLALFF